MATMRWKKVSVPIAQGIDTKTDEKAVPSDKLINLENGVFTKGGSIVKRNGYDELDTSMIATQVSGLIGDVRAVHSKDEELVIADGESLYSYLPGEDVWSRIGRFKSVIVGTEIVADSTAKQDVADCATSDNITVYAWEQDGSGVYFSIVNEQTGTVYVAGTVLSAGGSRPRVVGVGSFIHVYYYDSGTMYRLLVSTANVEDIVLNGSSASTSTVATDMHGSVCIYDFYSDGISVYIAYYTSHGSNKLKVAHQTKIGTSLGVLDYAVVPDGCLTITKEPNTGMVAVSYHDDTSNNVEMVLLGEDSLAKLYEFTLEGSVASVSNITAEFNRDPVTRPKNYVLDLEKDLGQHAYATNNAVGDSLDIDGDFTFELWFKAETVPGSGLMIFLSRHEGTASTRGYVFQWNGSSTKPELVFHNASGVTQTITSTATWTPSLGTWYHLAVSRDRAGAEVKFYVNGVILGSAVGSVSTDRAPDSEAIFKVGAVKALGAPYGGTPVYVDGAFSDVRVWNLVRSVANILGNMNSEQVGTTAGLAGYWRFNNDYADSTANERALTASSTVEPPIFQDSLVAGFSSTFTTIETELLDDNYRCVVFYEIPAAGNILRNNKVRTAAATLHANLTAASSFKLHAGIASHAWRDQDDVQLCLAFHSTLQTTYFIYMDDGTMIGKMEDGVAGGVALEKSLPGVQDLGGGLHQWVGSYRVRLDTTNIDLGGETATSVSALTAVYTQDGIKRFRMDFQHADAHRMVESGGCAYFNGAQIWKYDSQNIVESGLGIFPEDFTAAVSTVVGSFLEAGEKYWYRVYATWINARGEKERSECAATIQANLGGGSNNVVTLTIPTITHTNKKVVSGVGREINFEIYRTVGTPTGNEPFYKVSSDDPTDTTGENRYLANSHSVDDQPFVDRMTDSDLVAKEVDYQNSGELGNLAPPSASIMTEGKNRIFIAGLQDGSEVRYSKVRYPEQSVDFNDALSMTVPEEAGAITGMAILNEVLIVFKKRRIYAISGEGPNNLGFGFFSEPQLVISDVGCIAQNSIVTTPDGVMFQSEKGIYVLTPQFSAMYIGAPVELYNSQTVTAATVFPGKNQVVFLTSGGRTLLYDYFFRQWSTFTNHTGVDAAIWDGTYCYGSTGGKIFRETPGVHRDAGAAIKLRIETAWIRLDTMQGFQRVRRAMVLGEFKSSHRLAVEMAYDYEDLRRRVIFDAGSLVAATFFGDPSGTFGDGDPFGSGTTTSEMESSVYQLKAHTPVQKCQAIKFYFEDLADSSGIDLEGGYEITELMLEVGIKKGGFKIADTRSL